MEITLKDILPPLQTFILLKKEKGMDFVPSGIMAFANMKRNADLLMRRSHSVIFKKGVTGKRLVSFFTSSLSAIAAFNKGVTNSIKVRARSIKTNSIKVKANRIKTNSIKVRANRIKINSIKINSIKVKARTSAQENKERKKKS